MIAVEVKQIIKNSNSLDLHGYEMQVYSYFNPLSAETNVNKIVVLCTEISNNPIKYGSNNLLAKKGEVQVQIFFPERYEYDTELFENQIIKILEKEQWLNSLSRTGVDPEVRIPYTTLHFSKERGIKWQQK